MSGGIRVLVVDDDPIVRAWVRESLMPSEFEVIGEAESASQAQQLCAQRIPDVLLLDQWLRDDLGTDLLRALRLDGVAAPAVLMTASSVAGLNETAREAGAQGTVRKSAHRDKLLDALREVLAGRQAFDREHPRRPPGHPTLSPREREVLRLVAGGSTNAEIATALGLSRETIKTLLDRARLKLGARRRTEAVSEARRLGLIA